MKALAVLAFALLPTLAAAETYKLKAGDPAPTDGELLDVAAASQAVQDITQLPLYKAQVETLKAQVAAKDAQIAALSQIIELKDQQIALKQEEIEMHKRLEERMDAALKMSERANETAIKAAEVSTNALHKMQEKVDSANTRGFWTTIFGILGGLAVGLLLL